MSVPRGLAVTHVIASITGADCAHVEGQVERARLLEGQPCLEWLAFLEPVFQVDEHQVVRPGLQDDLALGGNVRPSASGRMVMMPSLTAISWISVRPEMPEVAAMSRSGWSPVLRMTR